MKKGISFPCRSFSKKISTTHLFHSAAALLFLCSPDSFACSPATSTSETEVSPDGVSNDGARPHCSGEATIDDGGDC